MILESKETFKVNIKKAGEQSFRPFGASLQSIEAVRKRIKFLKKEYPGCECETERTTLIIQLINPDTFNA